MCGAGKVIQLRSVTLPFEEAFRAKDWENALKIAERIPAQDRANARMLLMEARCHQQLGKFSNAQRAAARVLEAAAGVTPAPPSPSLSLCVCARARARVCVCVSSLSLSPPFFRPL